VTKRKTIKQKILEKEEQAKEKALKREQDKKLQDEVRSFANTSLHMYNYFSYFKNMIKLKFIRVSRER